MPANRSRAGGFARFAVPAASAATAAVGAALLVAGAEAGSSPPRPSAAAAVGRAPHPAVPARLHAAAPRPLPFAAPTRVRIPALSVDSPVVKVTMDKGGFVSAPPPDNPRLTGWFTNAVAPGQQGTAVIDGHVDTQRGPAVFYRLGTLHKGDRVEVSRADGRTAVFTVYGVELFAKNDFPSARVYGSTGRPELRVITCGGGYTKKGGYDGNTVVFARLSQIRP